MGLDDAGVDAEIRQSSHCMRQANCGFAKRMSGKRAGRYGDVPADVPVFSCRSTHTDITALSSVLAEDGFRDALDLIYILGSLRVRMNY